MKALTHTAFNFSGQTGVYKGKVRDVYHIGENLLVMVATDRISAFDVVLPRGIPYKGQVLNQLANHFLDATAPVVPNWKISSPDPNVTIGRRCQPFAVEMVIRACLTGSAWRQYRDGQRNICGNQLPDGMREHQRFQSPIITPTTKAHQGHDLDISPKDIVNQKLMTMKQYETLAAYTRMLFDAGSRMAAERGLMLVDTKYEFGFDSEGNILLIDEIHTPDSSRYFYAESYERQFAHGLPQHQLSKEFVREWLMQQGFMGQENRPAPAMPDEFVDSVTNRYIELYEILTGKAFVKTPYRNIESRIMLATEEALKMIG
ncbi:MAG TPA: phosphoribosylaminoimidazolesuccinocarboxamide synthase [Bacteroidales bacterium]|nr:phosphoribosylaminoimidazolesuccinocarboxamide synthase [Bacteroidales bacterium]